MHVDFCLNLSRVWRFKTHAVIGTRRKQNRQARLPPNRVPLFLLLLAKLILIYLRKPPCQPNLSFGCSSTRVTVRLLQRAHSFHRLSIKGCSHFKKKEKKERKKTVWREKTRLTNPEVEAAATSEIWGDSPRTSFSPLHSRRQKKVLLGRVPQTWKWSKPRANPTVCYCYRSCAMIFIKIETIGTATKMSETLGIKKHSKWMDKLERDRNRSQLWFTLAGFHSLFFV